MDLERLLAWAPTAVSSAVFATVHGAFAIGVARARLRGPGPARRRPRVSVLKPIAGVDDELAENLASFAAQSHDDYEVLFGFASASDPALPIVRRFLDAHPALAGRVVFTDRDAAENPKVAQLVGLAREATGEVLVISDANVRAPRHYLAELCDRLDEPRVGLVSSLVVGTGARTLGAALDAGQLGAYIAPAVVGSSLLANRAITIGKSMACRRADLERLGGLAIVRDVLAEDDVLGQRFRDAGFRVTVSLLPVENRNVGASLARTLDRHTRWEKMRRAIAPRVFLIEPLASPVMVALLVAIAIPSSLALRALAFAFLLQLLAATIAHGLLRGRLPRWELVAVEPLRWLLAFASWLGAWASRTVIWRGHALRIGAGTKLTPLAMDDELDVEPVEAEAARDVIGT